MFLYFKGIAQMAVLALYLVDRCSGHTWHWKVISEKAVSSQPEKAFRTYWVFSNLLLWMLNICVWCIHWTFDGFKYPLLCIELRCTNNQDLKVTTKHTSDSTVDSPEFYRLSSMGVDQSSPSQKLKGISTSDRCWRIRTKVLYFAL